MHLIADVGNTRTKLYLFACGEQVEASCAPADAAATVKRWAATYEIDACALSVVGPPDAALEQALLAVGCPVLRVTGTTPVPLQNAYSTPETLGPDRLAAVVGAAALKPGHPLLVVDVGTCVKYDFVTASGRYLGGNISPGMGMRFRALHEFTACLPLVDGNAPVCNPGHSTETAIRAGVVHGMRLEIEGYIRFMEKKHPDLLIFLTGGDRANFCKPSKNRIFANCNLVAYGLERILEHNLRGGAQAGFRAEDRPTRR